MANLCVDDTSISYFSNSTSTINNAINEDLESLKTWLEENMLSLNTTKTHCTLMGNRNIIRAPEQSSTPLPSTYVGNDKVSPITSTKYLGVAVFLL